MGTLRRHAGRRFLVAVALVLASPQVACSVVEDVLDPVHADQVAFNSFNGLGAGVGRRFDRGNIANDDRSDQGVTDLGNRAGQFDVGGLEHRVGAFNERDQPAGFNESNSLMGHNLFDR